MFSLFYWISVDVFMSAAISLSWSWALRQFVKLRLHLPLDKTPRSVEAPLLQSVIWFYCIDTLCRV